MTTRTALLLLPLLTSLVACGAPLRDDDDADTETGCDGEQDVGEFYADESFDADGDGFFDASDPGCADFYSADQLDCDDDDALVNPDQAETTCNGTNDDCDADTPDDEDLDGDGHSVCDGDCDDLSEIVFPGAEDEPCNGVDEDCNGDDGEPCDLEYDGTWALASAIQWECTTTEIDFDALEINHEDDDIAVTPNGCGACDPDNLQGSFTSDTQFTAAQTVAGACQAEFSMLGTFTSAAALTGNLSVNFVGADCVAFGCTGQVFNFTATR